MRPKILLIGDSLTQTSFENGGWGSQLASAYQRRADVLNRGYSGYNTEWYMRLLSPPASLSSAAVTAQGQSGEANESALTPWSLCSEEEYKSAVLIIVFLGANDAALQDMAPSHVPLERYRANLLAIVNILKSQSPSASMLMVTPPPIVHDQRLQYQRQRYGDKATGIAERTLENTGEYARVCCEVAQEANVPFVDLYNDMIKSITSTNTSSGAADIADVDAKAADAQDATTSEEKDATCSEEDNKDAANEQPTESDNAAKTDTPDSSSTHWHEYFYDGLHFSSAGQAIVGKAMLDAIASHYPDLAVIPDPATQFWCNSASQCASLDAQGPFHDQIDPSMPDVGFTYYLDSRKMRALMENEAKE
jgi:isoamyl acetate esterase